MKITEIKNKYTNHCNPAYRAGFRVRVHADPYVLPLLAVGDNDSLLAYMNTSALVLQTDPGAAPLVLRQAP